MTLNAATLHMICIPSDSVSSGEDPLPIAIRFDTPGIPGILLWDFKL